jgi:hypothetical protein
MVCLRAQIEAEVCVAISLHRVGRPIGRPMYRRIQSRMWCVGNGFHGREATSSPYAPEFRLYGEASDVVETGSDGTSRTSLNETAEVGDRDACLDAT